MRLGNKCKQWAIAALVMCLLLTGCSANENQNDLNDAVDAETVISENIADSQQEDIKEEQPEEPEEDVSDSQSVVPTDDREIVCENPYFFPQNITAMASKVTYVSAFGDYYVWHSTWTELELHWLKQYDNGCLAKLSVLPFGTDGIRDSEIPLDYFDESRLNIYFYVTADEIYQVYPYMMQEDEPITFYNDDATLISVYDTDEKLLDNGELIFSLEDVEDPLEEGEAGIHASISRQDHQVSFNRVDISPDDEPGYYENFIWEDGIGLVDYKSGFNTENAAEAKFIYLEDIIYGTTDHMQDREIVCENPYFFPQDTTLLSVDITHELNFNRPINGTMELHWLKQYDNGCLARLSVVRFEDMPTYMDCKDVDMYFYVTPDEIYMINFYVSNAYEYIAYRKSYISPPDDAFRIDTYSMSYTTYADEYIDYYDNILMSVLDTDEKLLEWAELVCCPEEVNEDHISEDNYSYVGEERYPLGEVGIYHGISSPSENQIRYHHSEYPAGNVEYYNSLTWEYGKGLVEYIRGYRAMAWEWDLKNITIIE